MMRRTYNLIASALASAAVIGALQADAVAQDAASGEGARTETISSQHDRISALLSRMSGKEIARNDRQAAPAFFTEQPKAKSPLSLHVEGPSGNAVRLDYIPRNGWQSSGGQQAEGGPHRRVAQELESGTEPLRAAEEAGSDERPLSVFVDGPTGFVFVWTHEAHAWKFVGRVSEQ